MINLQQIENMLKAQGLTGDEFRWEFQRQALMLGKLMVDDILCGYNNTNFTWEDACVCLAHISEIFVRASFHDFDSDFAEHFQTMIFNSTPEQTKAELEWCRKLFSDKTEKVEETEKPLSVQSEKSDIETENTALLLSGLLNNPNVPETIRGGVAQGIEDLFNSEIDQSEILDFHRSPEYIAMVLRGTGKTEVSE